MRFASLAVAFAVAASPLAAQAAHPDFTGKWTLDPSSISDPNMAPSSMTIDIVQDAKTLKSDVVAATPMGEQKSSSTVNLDGSVSKNTVNAGGMSMETTATSSWDGNTLVVTTKAEMQGQPISYTDHWTLGPDGKTMTLERNISMGGQAMTMKMGFKKA